MSNELSKEQLQQAIERAATSMLTDQEIMSSLSITQEILDEHYESIVRARVNLKQKLNAKRISDAASGNGEAGILADMIPRNNVPMILEKKQKLTKDGRDRSEINRQNALLGGGRPQGSTNKLTAQTLLQNIADKTGKPFGELLAEGYHEAIQSNDKHMRAHYEKMLIGKVVAEQVNVDINNSESVLEAKQRVFELALQALHVNSDTQLPSPTLDNNVITVTPQLINSRANSSQQ